ncbi:MAG: MlaD family protein, partial [Bacteroidales bacterium]|nr:MlaD family protein [Bacteroidales bacterium]
GNMKKFSKEVIVGLSALITILVFIWLFSFLKGNNIFNRDDRYYAIYDDIGGLEESGLVEINGHKAGIVRSIKFINDGSGRLLVTLNINRGYKIPSGTLAKIEPETILAGMKVNLVMGEGPDFLSSGDTLQSLISTGMMDEINEKLSPVVSKADQVIADIDTLLDAFKLIITDDLRKNLHNSAENVESISKRVDRLLADSDENINKLISNLNSFSEMLSRNNTVMDSTINNIALVAGKLSGTDLEASVNDFNSAVKETSMMLEKLNRGEGSAGLLLNDDTLYTELTRSLEQLNLLLEDLKSNPGRYVNFSIFGRNK